MTNEEMIQDLKQFIEATISQQMADVATKDDIKQLSGRIDRLEVNMATKKDVAKLDQQLDTIQDAIADTLTHTAEDADAKFEDHEQRLRRLEHRAA
jgi:hypothetical protein